MSEAILRKDSRLPGVFRFNPQADQLPQAHTLAGEGGGRLREGDLLVLSDDDECDVALLTIESVRASTRGREVRARLYGVRRWSLRWS